MYYDVLVSPWKLKGGDISLAANLCNVLWSAQWHRNLTHQCEILQSSMLSQEAEGHIFQSRQGVLSMHASPLKALQPLVLSYVESHNFESRQCSGSVLCQDVEGHIFQSRHGVLSMHQFQPVAVPPQHLPGIWVYSEQHACTTHKARSLGFNSTAVTKFAMKLLSSAEIMCVWFRQTFLCSKITIGPQ